MRKTRGQGKHWGMGKQPAGATKIWKTWMSYSSSECVDVLDPPSHECVCFSCFSFSFLLPLQRHKLRVATPQAEG